MINIAPSVELLRIITSLTKMRFWELVIHGKYLIFIGAEYRKRMDANIPWFWNQMEFSTLLDGKHCNINAPPNSGSLYFNHKGVHSVVLMTLVDANYKFIYINIGSKGRDSDGGVFNDCFLSSALKNNTLNVPSAQPLPQRDVCTSTICSSSRWCFPSWTTHHEAICI